LLSELLMGINFARSGRCEPAYRGAIAAVALIEVNTRR